MKNVTCRITPTNERSHLLPTYELSYNAKPSWKCSGEGAAVLRVEKHPVAGWVQIKATETAISDVALASHTKDVYITIPKGQVVQLIKFLTQV